MVSKNNVQVKDRYATKQVPHYGIRKLSVGVASVLLGTTFYMGMNGNVVHADTVNGQDGETPDSQVANNNDNNSKSDLTADSDANNALGNGQAVVSAAEGAVKSEINAKPQVTEINNDSHVQSDVANVNSDLDVQSQNNQNGANTTQATQTQTMRVNNFVSQVGNISPNAVSANLKESNDNTVTASTAGNAASDSALTAPVAGEVSNKPSNQIQPASATDTTQTKLVHRPVMRLAAATTTDSDELIVGKDVTISDFSVTAANGKNEFENSHANIKFTMHADDPSALVGKRLTIRLGKVWDGFYTSRNQGSNPTTISYQGQVIGTLNYGYPYNFVYITFNNHVKDYTNINLQSDLVVAGTSQNDSLYQTNLYTPT